MELRRLDVPHLSRPAAVNAAEYWFAPARFMDRCERLGDRFMVPMPGTGPWLCLTNPADVKRVFTADTGALRLGAALAKASPHILVLGPAGLTNVDGAAHTRKRRMQNPPFHGTELANYEATMQRTVDAVVASWPFGHAAQSLPLMRTIALEVIVGAVFGVTDPVRAQRLRAATLALMDEGNSRRFLVQSMIASSRPGGWDRPFPRMRAAIEAVDVVLRDELAARRAADDLERSDVLSVLMRTVDDQGAPLSDAELCDDMRTLLLGGAPIENGLCQASCRHPEQGTSRCQLGCGVLQDNSVFTPQ